MEEIYQIFFLTPLVKVLDNQVISSRENHCATDHRENEIGKIAAREYLNVYITRMMMHKCHPLKEWYLLDGVQVSFVGPHAMVIIERLR